MWIVFAVLAVLTIAAVTAHYKRVSNRAIDQGKVYIRIKKKRRLKIGKKNKT